MGHMRLLTGVLAVFLGAQAAVGVTHGEVSEYNGQNVRWQELAEGFFTGVPQDEWDDDYNARGIDKWDIDEIMASSNISMLTDGTETQLDTRDIRDTCEAAAECVRKGGQYVLLLGFSAWVSAAKFAADKKPGKTLMEFLNQPFYANSFGVAIAGIISGQVNSATATECSTTNSQADIVRAAVEAVLENNSQAQEVSVDITGPGGTINVKIRAGPPGTTPNPSC